MVLGEYYRMSDPAVKYNFIERQFVGWNSYTMPMTFRKLVQVQLSDQMRTAEQPLGDNRSRHIKAFMAGTVGAAFTVIARVIRISVRTLLFIPSAVIRSTTATRYGVEGAMKDFFTRYKEEWIDLMIMMQTIPLGLIKSWHPSAYSNTIDSINTMYLVRADRKDKFDAIWNKCQANYQMQVQDAALVRKKTVESKPSLSEI